MTWNPLATSLMLSPWVSNTRCSAFKPLRKTARIMLGPFTLVKFSMSSMRSAWAEAVTLDRSVPKPCHTWPRFWPELSVACILFQPPEILLLWWEWLASNKKDADAPFLMMADQGRGCVWSDERNKSTGLKNQFFKTWRFCEKHIHFCTDWESTYGRIRNWQKHTTASLCRILDMNFGSGVKSACLQTVWREHVSAHSVRALVWTCPMTKRQLFLCLSVLMFTRCTGSPSSVCNSNLGL